MSDTALTVLGMSFIFVMTTAGSSIVYFFKNQISQKANTLFLGFASGIMIAASVWSLLIPAIGQATEKSGKLGFLPIAIGFVFGGLFLVALDYTIPHLHASGEEEGPHVQVKKSIKLFLAVTIHNIPEGLAVGFAFGAAAAAAEHSAFVSALGLAIGIGVQNFPEGAAVALPLKSETGSKNKAFLYGMGTGIVEPVFAVIGYFLTAIMTTLQPWLMSFAAGAMIFVVAEDLIPDAKLETSPHLGTWGVMVGFVVMMILEVALG